MDRRFIINDIEITFLISSTEYIKQVEEIIADFKQYLPDFKSDSSNILFMLNKEKKRRLLYFMNRFQINLDYNANPEEQLTFLYNAVTLINRYTFKEELSCSIEFSFFTPFENNSFSKKLKYSSISNNMKNIKLDTLGFSFLHNEDEYDIWVYEGELEDKDNSIRTPGFLVTVNHEKEISSSNEWENNWKLITQELPEEIVTFLANTFIQ